MRVGTRIQQRTDGLQLPVGGGIVQRRVTVLVGGWEKEAAVEREREERCEEGGGAGAGREH